MLLMIISQPSSMTISFLVVTLKYRFCKEKLGCFLSRLATLVTVRHIHIPEFSWLWSHISLMPITSLWVRLYLSRVLIDSMVISLVRQKFLDLLSYSPVQILRRVWKSEPPFCRPNFRVLVLLLFSSSYPLCAYYEVTLFVWKLYIPSFDPGGCCHRQSRQSLSIGIVTESGTESSHIIL